MKNKNHDDVLLSYSKYCLPVDGLGTNFLEEVEQLFTGLKHLRTNTNLTALIDKKNNYERNINKIPKKGWPIENVIQNVILNYLGNVPNWSAGYAPSNVIPPSLSPAILAKFACAIVNPNLAYESYAGKTIEAEQLAIAHIAEIVGFKPNSAFGYFTSGGSAGNYWAVRCAIEKTFPGWGKKGFRAFSDKRPVVIQSVLGHYTNLNAARLLGIGSENVMSVPVTPNFDISLEAFRATMEEAVAQNKQVVCIYLIAGCTDSFGVDDIKSIYEIRETVCKKYNIPKPHIHVDAAVGWIYGIFKNYPLAENPLTFDSETIGTIQKLNNLYSNLHYADSITVDPHKHGFTSYSSSALIFKDKQNLLLLQKDIEETPYFTEDSFGLFPGAYTPESSRPGDGPLMILANLYALGYEGYQAMIGHAIQKSNVLQSKLQFNFRGYIKIFNQNIPGTSTVWRFYPDEIDAQVAYERELFGVSEKDRIFTQKINDYNYELFLKSKSMRCSDTPILGYSQQVIVGKSGIPIGGWKCILINPLVNIDSVLDSLRTLMKANTYASL